ncbi:flagellar basal body protein FliL [Marinobacter vulgaris]|uniref:Flagellar protein FliL n=1 Tax=Marinobacter vulgaris TaxID=1928331 RepID=A0A2V3ZMH0_9GAMM|nr:flagellar basal body-associated FliL family protein [Marinobacter vulgaris]PXX92292.1 flagellar basal body protein FliL [Marinobacter vulgaris]TSJ71765.1 flagellar basal body-associated FliL family protein [Marinobacter vulgaris]
MTLKPKHLLLALLITLAPAAFAQDEEEAEQEQQQEPGITDYIAMEPPFVTHVGEPGTRLTYLKAAVTLRASRETTRPAVEAHMPRLRHELVMLFGEQTDTQGLSGNKGQQALREEAASRINAVLEEQQTGESITGVLFTEFVVQK